MMPMQREYRTANSSASHDYSITRWKPQSESGSMRISRTGSLQNPALSLDRHHGNPKPIPDHWLNECNVLLFREKKL